MRDKIISILGMKKDSSDKEVINKISDLVFDLRGKKGFFYSTAIEKFKGIGFLRFDAIDQTWNMRITDRAMNNILDGKFD